jgi:hypothetical protein
MQKNQTFVLKINTGYLSKHNWNLNLELHKIQKDSQMVVSLGSSQVLRWLVQLQGRQNDDLNATNIKKEIKQIKKQENSAENKNRIKDLYNQLYKTQFQQDYMMLVMDSVSDYRYVCKHGFKITIDYGDCTKKTVTYRRFLGTAGSIKKSTIMFVNYEVHDELMRRINNGRYQGPKVDKKGNALEPVKQHNGRDLGYKFIPAKINAYFALQCSASISVPWPRVIVVDDAYVKFNAAVREVRDVGDARHPEWPSVTDPIVKELECDVSDGMGFITPEMSAKWAEALNEGPEPLSGYNTRCAFLKGMLFTVDYIKFAEEIAGTYKIKDAWGDIRDVRDSDAIVTVSMLKLWSSYAGYEDYYHNCMINGYEFCVAKSSPRELRNVHTTNYQYLQDFKLSDEQIDRLISPTVTKIKECLGLDWRKLILYMCGTGLDEHSVLYADPVCKAVMANPKLVDDPYIRAKVSRMIQQRIKAAKIGVLDIEGDYAIIGGDPYSLLQSMFGMEITGLLKANECYHRYWTDKGVNEIVAFRAPMTSHENVCKLNVACTEEMDKWYKYIKTCCILNSWDTTAMRCNGADFDSDTFFTTSNQVLLESFEYKPTLMCLQDSMPKVVPTEQDYIQSDINGFGDSIGSVTNKATNMISLREQFAPDSEEYKRLTYRISTMMNFQQNAIDRIKGVVARPVPREWLDSRMFKINPEDDELTIREKQINANIAAETKPWFFIYRYSALNLELTKYLQAAQSNCKIRFGKTIDDLYATNSRTEDEEAFLFHYEKYMPVSRAPGTMNRICWKIEDAFKTTNVLPNVSFDYSILKNSSEYSAETFAEIQAIYEDYNKNIKLSLKNRKKNEEADNNVGLITDRLKQIFIEECDKVCPDSRVLSNIVVDLCYGAIKNNTFVWDVVGEQIFQNVLENNGGKLYIPIRDDNGNVEFYGERFSICEKMIGGEADDYIE